jgi:DNA-directed RNA polymerase specialized sigma24 family protein
MTDVSQFEAFVRKYQDRVFATALRLLGSRSNAEELPKRCS